MPPPSNNTPDTKSAPLTPCVDVGFFTHIWKDFQWHDSYLEGSAVKCEHITLMDDGNEYFPAAMVINFGFPGQEQIYCLQCVIDEFNIRQFLR
jgi:hypothetical protein